MTLAFGDLTFPVLVERLSDPDAPPEVLRAASRAALRLLPTPLNTVHAVDAGAIPVFVRLASHPDVVIRRTATELVAQAMRSGTAKKDFVETGQLRNFKQVVEDDDAAVRSHALTALESLAYAAPWADALQGNGYVPLLVARAKVEAVDAVKAATLRALAKTVNAGGPGQREAVADATATKTLIELLAHFAVAVREEAARVLALLAFSPEGKALAVAHGAVPVLLKMIGEDAASRVRAEAAAAVMAIAVDNDGKQACLEAGLQPLVDLIQSSDPFARQCAMRAVATIAANPAARHDLTMLRGVVPVLTTLRDTAGGREKEIVEKTLEVVSWKP